MNRLVYLLHVMWYVAVDYGTAHGHPVVVHERTARCSAEENNLAIVKGTSYADVHSGATVG